MKFYNRGEPVQLPQADDEDDISDCESSPDSRSLDNESSDPSTKSRSTGGKHRNTPALAHGETQTVHRLRFLTFGILVVVTTLASVGVYIYTKGDESNEFDVEFKAQGEKVIEGFRTDSHRKLQALYSLSSTVTAHALDNNDTWPYVTLPHSSNLLEPYLALANAAAIVMLNVIPKDQRAEWEIYSVAHQGWIDEALVGQKDTFKDDYHRLLSLSNQTQNAERRERTEISPYIQNYVGIDTSPGIWVVWWQYVPVIENRWFVNFNRLAWDGFAEEAALLMDEQKAVLSQTWTFEPGLDFQSTKDFEFTSELLRAGGNDNYQSGEPLGYIYYPVFDHFGANATTVSILSASVYWRTYFEDILPDSARGVVCVVENNAGQSFTYQIDGKEATFLGMDDLHDPKFEHMEIAANYSSFIQTGETEADYRGVPVDDHHMSYRIRVYPSAEFKSVYITRNPAIYTSAMVLIFLLTAGIFITYDCQVERRQRVVMTTAEKSTAVVSSLFPAAVRDRLLESAPTPEEERKPFTVGVEHLIGRNPSGSKATPIADFFPETTLMFADIRGFTAWSSAREPAQVFTLLETIYSAFDEIAERRRVYKVETVGDCYLAACGVPHKRKDHAVAMARFSRDCLHRFNMLVREMEISLGPDTGDLALRIGVHSGPVTGGVIRGGNARYQLFGDTVNTAARMESTGRAGAVQISQDTMTLLEAAGKSSWYKPREVKVHAKGKGEMQTYWLITGVESDTKSTGSAAISSNGSDYANVESAEDPLGDRELDPITSVICEKTQRLVTWNSEVLTRLLMQIVARRKTCGNEQRELRELMELEENLLNKSVADKTINEVREIIHLPAYNSASGADKRESVELDERVKAQLRDFVQAVASMYQDNHFHNFEHASHVTMSVQKLLSRIIAPAEVIDMEHQSLHDHTYGITSDPLTQFACVFSALIHDVDHSGVPNAQLVKEKCRVAAFYNGKSVAEQNSVDLAWNLLMHSSYKELRATIYSTEAEMIRFRQLVVNSVMATDIVDKDLKNLRNSRWEKAFQESSLSESSKDSIDRKATIVIEHLIQASDVAHTMQHWHIYRKWNERFFLECYGAYKSGRAEKDPSEGWYKGEIGFFDFYIIPLAKKLKECGVFGVASDEYLNYAIRNRNEWELRGREVVSEMCELASKSGKMEQSLAARH